MHQYTPLTVVVPAGTAIASPLAVTWTLYPGWLESVKIDIPKGHKRLTGIRVTYKGTPVIPFHSTTWILGDGQTHTVPFRDQVMNTGLVVQAYNTDAWPHTFYLYADVDPHIPGERPPGVALADWERPRRAVLDQVRTLRGAGRLAS